MEKCSLQNDSEDEEDSIKVISPAVKEHVS